MSKKKRSNTPAAKVRPPVKNGIGAKTWVSGAVALVAVAAVFAIAIGGNKPSNGAAPAAGAPVTTPIAARSAGGAAPSAEEAPYIGRLLPAGYKEPSIGEPVAYSSTVKMSDVVATRDAKKTTLSVADVVAKRIVYFQYQQAGGAPLSMIAYVKPSGKLFVGVGFCIPCNGERQDIDADGTLRCQACGTKRDLESGAGISGACKLYPLDEVPAAIAGGKIVVQNSDLDAWTPQPLDRKVGA